ncbi:DUF4238 domain-containing protein [Fluviicola chungangensis]|uniref:DUF4238 domain-containing protein n=1 Tax=Fluviicola chungangensis TaxID=2597671 RepID=A0A556MP39_9FLAO|nr:DUF4238 domain-containing protein [Fluviicola chungangensis]TSJ41489.1 DUF4238 domain-containing protein [Fluviicola chungangensis]
MSKPVRQHFIPRSYLNNFSESMEGKYFIHGKRHDSQQIVRLSTKDICIERNLYTIPTNDGEKNFDVEHFYADKVDSVFPTVYTLIKDPNVRTIDFETRLKIITTALSLYFRTPKFLNIQNNFFERQIKHAFENTTKDEVIISFLGEEPKVNRNEVEEIIKERKEHNRIRFLIQHLQDYENLVQSKLMDDISVYHIVDDSEFITSDNPVIIRAFVDPTSPDYDEEEYFKKEINPFEKTNMIHLPLDRKTMLTIIPRADNNVSSLFRRMDIEILDVLMYNSDIEKNAESWILGSKNGIEKHIEDQRSFNVETPENLERVRNYKEKALAFSELKTLMEKKGLRSAEVKEKVAEMNSIHHISSDRNFQKILQTVNSL